MRLAEDAAKRLLPAFDTPTGMPYGTVNLRNGVPNGETPVTSTAGVGTVVIEFGALSRLTGKYILPNNNKSIYNMIYFENENDQEIGMNYQKKKK